MRNAWIILLLICISGCGGSSSDPAPAPAPVATKAVTTFSTSIAPGQTETVGSVEFLADLPQGVTVPVDNNGMIDGARLSLIDGGLAATTQALVGRYIPSVNGAPAKVHIAAITVNAGDGRGMASGRFAVLTFDLTPGASVTADAFTQPYDTVITDPAGVEIPASAAQVSSVTVLQ